MTPSNPSVAVTVSIPVRVGGYTGQRDAWEEYERPFSVKVEGDTVILQTDGTNNCQQIRFPRSGFEAALEILGTLGG